MTLSEFLPYGCVTEIMYVMVTSLKRGRIPLIIDIYAAIIVVLSCCIHVIISLTVVRVLWISSITREKCVSASILIPEISLEILEALNVHGLGTIV